MLLKTLDIPRNYGTMDKKNLNVIPCEKLWVASGGLKTLGKLSENIWTNAAIQFTDVHDLCLALVNMLTVKFYSQ